PPIGIGTTECACRRLDPRRRFPHTSPTRAGHPHTRSAGSDRVLASCFAASANAIDHQLSRSALSHEVLAGKSFTQRSTRFRIRIDVKAEIAKSAVRRSPRKILEAWNRGELFS